MVFALRDYSQPDPTTGRQNARAEVPFLFKAFESGQAPPPRPGTKKAEQPRAATIHEYLDWTVTASEATDPDELVRRGRVRGAGARARTEQRHVWRCQITSTSLRALPRAGFRRLSCGGAAAAIPPAVAAAQLPRHARRAAQAHDDWGAKTAGARLAGVCVWRGGGGASCCQRAAPCALTPPAPPPAGTQVHNKPICAATIRLGPGWMEVPFYATQELRRNKGEPGG